MKLPGQYIDYHRIPLKSSQCINICAFMSISPDIDQQDAGEHCALCSIVQESVDLRDIQYLISMMMSNIHMPRFKLK